MIGNAVRRILDANPSLCLPDPMGTNATDAEYLSNDAKSMIIPTVLLQLTLLSP